MSDSRPTLKNRLNSLENMFKLPIETRGRTRSPKNFNLDLEVPKPQPSPSEGGQTSMAAKPNKPLFKQDMGSPRTRSVPPSLSMRPRPPTQLLTGHKGVADKSELDKKYDEILKRTGYITVEGVRYPCSPQELEPLGELGHGTCGQVIKMRHRATGHCVAVKQMRRSGNEEENKRILTDLETVLKSHDCPYIVRCIGAIITESDVWICMELMSSCLDKVLRELREPLPDPVLAKVALAAVKALHYLKDTHNIIHRDVKPSNILIDERGNIKLCDFSISGQLIDSKAKTLTAGCAAYMAPERIDPPNPKDRRYDIRADVWSLGISLVELATGHFPYKACSSVFEVMAKVMQEPPPKLSPVRGHSTDMCEFVNKCLEKDYTKRPKYRTLLEHKFIQRADKEVVDVAGWYSCILERISIKQQAKTPPSEPPSC